MRASGAQQFRRIIWSAICAGVLIGLIVTGIELSFTVPLIREAEQYEQAPQVSANTHTAHAHGASYAQPWFTAITTTFAAIGYGCLLGAVLASLNNINWRRGLLFGLAGFCAFQLAPAIGLGVALPGVVQTDLPARQLWWTATAVSTCLGLAAAWFGMRYRRWHWAIAALLLVIVPHLIGAPKTSLVTKAATVPAALQQHFVVLSLAASAVFWLLLGSAQGYLLGRWSRPKS